VGKERKQVSTKDKSEKEAKKKMREITSPNGQERGETDSGRGTERKGESGLEDQAARQVEAEGEVKPKPYSDKRSGGGGFNRWSIVKIRTWWGKKGLQSPYGLSGVDGETYAKRGEDIELLPFGEGEVNSEGGNFCPGGARTQRIGEKREEANRGILPVPGIEIGYNLEGIKTAISKKTNKGVASLSHVLTGRGGGDPPSIKKGKVILPVELFVGDDKEKGPGTAKSYHQVITP